MCRCKIGARQSRTWVDWIKAHSVVYGWLYKTRWCLKTIISFTQCCSLNSSLLFRLPGYYLLQIKPLNKCLFFHIAPSHDYQMSNSWIACLGIHSFPPNAVHPYPVLFTSNLRNPVPYRRTGSLVLLRTPVGLSPLVFSTPTALRRNISRISPSSNCTVFGLIFQGTAGYSVSVCVLVSWSNRWWCRWSESQSVDASGPFNLLTGYETDGQQTAFLKQSMWLNWCCSGFVKWLSWRLCKNYTTSSTTVDRVQPF